ncbi:MAG: hypothetical protein C0467_31865 [Planctomycetaceae bacterium]|nr:hypothetical protein [Planctomycetaceae bacterium]
MATAIKSRLLVLRTDSDRLRVLYGPLDYRNREDFNFERLLTVVGPAAVEPPSQEMTREEFNRWRFNLVCDTGYSLVGEATKLTAPLVEEIEVGEIEVGEIEVEEATA